jgi:hypothetical protein
MSKNGITGLMFALLWGCASPGWAQLQLPVGPPTPKVGEIARYKTTDLWNNKELRTSQAELVEIQADRYVLRTSNSTRPEPVTAHFTSHWQPCRTMKDSDKSVCAGALKFPMQVGDKYGYEKLPWPNGNGHSSASCEVKAEEKVSLPAGTFDTLRVECAGFWNRVFGGTFSGRQSEVHWYAPSISRIVKTEFTNYDAGGKMDVRERGELVEFVAKP